MTTPAPVPVLTPSALIDDLTVNVGQEDRSADDIVPPIESDPFLVELARLVQTARQKKASPIYHVPA